MRDPLPNRHSSPSFVATGASTEACIDAVIQRTREGGEIVVQPGVGSSRNWREHRMKSTISVIGTMLALLGLASTLIGWFGPRIGDGFTNIGRIVVGVPVLLVGVVLMLVGIGRSATSDTGDPPAPGDR